MFLTEESTTGAVRKEGLEPDETDLKEQEEVGLGYTTLTSHVLFPECAGKQNATVQTFQNTHNIDGTLARYMNDMSILCCNNFYFILICNKRNCEFNHTR